MDTIVDRHRREARRAARYRRALEGLLAALDDVRMEQSRRPNHYPERLWRRFHEEVSEAKRLIGR